MTTLSQYINDVAVAIRYQNGAQLPSLLSITIPYETLITRSSFLVPTRLQLQQLITDTKWHNVVESYIKLVKLICQSDVLGAFLMDLQLLENLNRCAEKQDNWILDTMYLVDKELKRLYDASREKETLKSGEESSLEKMARVISTSFQLCLNDRNSEVERSKRKGVYFFIGELFKIYSSLQKNDLARSTEKLFTSLRRELPQIDDISKSHAVTYLYFSGSISCADNDLDGAYEKLSKALELTLAQNQESQQISILLLLIPIKFLQTRQMPSTKLWRKYPTISLIYKDLFIAVKRGDLKMFDILFQKIEKIMLKRQLYLIIMMMRSYVILKLFKKIWLALDCKPHVPISAFQIALEFSTSHRSVTGDHFKYSLDAAESQVARLISTGNIKGYLSHGNRVAVLSKLDPFPKLVI